MSYTAEHSGLIISDRLLMCHDPDKDNCLEDGDEGCRDMDDGAFAVCSSCRKYAECRDHAIEIKSCPNKQHWGFDSTKRQCRYKSPDCYDCSGMLKTVPLYSSIISHYTTKMFYSLQRFNRHRRPSSGTECSVVTAR